MLLIAIFLEIFDHCLLFKLVDRHHLQLTPRMHSLLRNLRAAFVILGKLQPLRLHGRHRLLIISVWGGFNESIVVKNLVKVRDAAHVDLCVLLGP